MTTATEGVVEVLSVGRGDVKITVDSDNPDEARKLIEGMLHAGYGIFVETARGLRRVKRFNPKRMTYVIADAPSPTAAKPEREVPVARSRARAVGATAGG